MNKSEKQEIISTLYACVTFLQNELRNCDGQNERADEIDELLGRLDKAGIKLNEEIK